MDLSITSYPDYNVISLKGDIRISAIPTITPQLASHIQNNSNKSLVLELSEVNSLDSSTFRLFLNLKKRIEQNKKNLYILNPSKEMRSILNEVNLDKVFSILDDIHSLQNEISSTRYNSFQPFTTPESSLLRLNCSCAVCGSKEIIGYLLDQDAYKWSWDQSTFFPSCVDKNDNSFDYFGMLPIVCMDCFMTSIDLNHFNINDKDSIVFKSTLDENSKLLLSKNIKKRKKTMEIDIAIGDRFFMYPRDKLACFQAYQLAEQCSRTTAVQKAGSNPFTIAYLNYLTIRYSDYSTRDELISNCRTWLTQMFTETENFNPTQIAQGYYIMLVASMSLDKYKEATKTFQDFTSMIKTLGGTSDIASIDNPIFWHEKAKSIWQNDISSKCMPLKPDHA